MLPIELSHRLNYPEQWIASGLLTEEFARMQGRQLEVEYGTAIPDGGTEHWRFAAFLHCLTPPVTEARWEALVQLAAIDPDPPMAGDAIRRIVADDRCSPTVLAIAKGVVAKSCDYCVSPEALQGIFDSRAPLR